MIGIDFKFIGKVPEISRNRTFSCCCSIYDTENVSEVSRIVPRGVFFLEKCEIPNHPWYSTWCVVEVSSNGMNESEPCTLKKLF